MNLELQNKTALVTGSTAGIGLAIATSLAREEATVIINGRTKERVDNAIKKIRSQYSDAKREPLVADVSESSAVASTFRQFPKVDILINNVGIGELKPFEKISDNDWSKLNETNFMSGVRLSRFYLPLIEKAGLGPHYFHIQRIWREHPQQHDSLRRYKDDADRFGAWVGRDDSRNRRYGQLDRGRADIDRGSEQISR